MQEPIDFSGLVVRVDTALADFMARQRPRLFAVAADLGPAADLVEEFVRQGGKRLRPVFALCGHLAAGGRVTDEVAAACAATELLHACALVHDDVMDGSDVRRGRPSVHRAMESLHVAQQWPGSAPAFGVAAAILLGDLLLAWSDDMFQGSAMPADALATARPVWDLMRTELMAGQYLDMLEQARAESDIDRALRVARYKSGKYTVERPLHLGAALAGHSPDSPLGRALTAYGIPLGEAFQLRDDVLGIYGDPTSTGKPAGDDLREGKRTALVAAALQFSSPAAAAELATALGRSDLDDDAVRHLCAAISDSGALAYVEDLIAERTEAARIALDDLAIDPAARDLLATLVRTSTRRAS